MGCDIHTFIEMKEVFPQNIEDYSSATTKWVDVNLYVKKYLLRFCRHRKYTA